MFLLTKGKAVQEICRYHRVAYRARTGCPVCREEHKAMMRGLGYVKVGRKWEMGPPDQYNPLTWREAEWEEARRNAKAHGVFLPGVIRTEACG